MSKNFGSGSFSFMAVIAVFFLISTFSGYAAASPEDKDARDWFEKGGLYAAYGNEDAAIKCFQKVLELNPDNTEAAFNLGLVYAEKGEYEKALDFINKITSDSKIFSVSRTIRLL